MGGGKQYRVRRAECEEKPSDTATRRHGEKAYTTLLSTITVAGRRANLNHRAKSHEWTFCDPIKIDNIAN